MKPFEVPEVEVIRFHTENVMNGGTWLESGDLNAVGDYGLPDLEER